MLTKIKLDQENRMLRVGVGKHDGNWFLELIYCLSDSGLTENFNHLLNDINK